MKSIHLIDKGSLILSFNKSGSTLFVNTLKLFLNWKGIPISSEFKGDGKVIIGLIRNPIDRFFSGFLHFYADTIERNTLATGSTIDYLLPKMESWIEGFHSNSEDPHYQRQGDILKGLGVTPTHLYKIESIGDEIGRIGNWEFPSANPDLGDNKPLCLEGELPLFTTLGIHLTHWDWQVFIGFYESVSRSLRRHHRGEDTSILKAVTEFHRPDLMRKIKSLMEGDMKRFDYTRMI